MRDTGVRKDCRKKRVLEIVIKFVVLNGVALEGVQKGDVI